MFKRFLSGALIAFLAVGVAVAADEIKLDLKTFKVKAASDDLGGFDENDNRLFLYTNGTLTGEAKVDADGEYTVVVEASCTEGEKNSKAQFKLTVGETVVKDKFELTSTDAKEYTFTAKFKKGENKIIIEFLNDSFKENEYDMNLFVHAVKLTKK